MAGGMTPPTEIELAVWDGIAGSVSKDRTRLHLAVCHPTLEQDDAMFLHGGPEMMRRLIAFAREKLDIAPPVPKPDDTMPSVPDPPPARLSECCGAAITMIEGVDRKGGGKVPLRVLLCSACLERVANPRAREPLIVRPPTLLSMLNDQLKPVPDDERPTEPTAEPAKPTPDLVLFARAFHVILKMVTTDVQTGMYGGQGRPNMTSILEFFMLGVVNLPELEAFARAWAPPGGKATWEEKVKEGRAYFGDIEALRKESAGMRELVERISPEKDRHDMYTGVPGVPGMEGPYDPPLRVGKSPGERAEMLAILDGVDPYAQANKAKN